MVLLLKLDLTTLDRILAPVTRNTRGPVPNSYLGTSHPECR